MWFTRWCARAVGGRRMSSTVSIPPRMEPTQWVASSLINPATSMARPAAAAAMASARSSCFHLPAALGHQPCSTISPEMKGLPPAYNGRSRQPLWHDCRGWKGQGRAICKLTPGNGGWTYTVLKELDDPCDQGCFPVGGVTIDAGGNLYGTTSGGGTHGQGVVWQITQ